MKLLLLVCISILVSCSTIISGTAYAEALSDNNYEKGIKHANQGEFEKAKVEFEKALIITPYIESLSISLKTVKEVLDNKIEAKAAIFLFKGALPFRALMHLAQIFQHLNMM